MSYPVKYFHSAMRGAPTVSGTAGALIGLLDACLLTGFGLTTVTGISVSGGVATATVSAGNSFEQGAIVLMDGDMPAELKGEVRALTSASTSFSYATAAADGTYTGSFTAKYAPVGQWEKAFSGTNLAAYRSTDLQGSGFFLRVDDSGTTTARIVAYEAMTGINDGSGPFPTSAQISGGGYWFKSSAASAAAAGYVLAADSRFLIFSAMPQLVSSASNTQGQTRGFGDILPLAPAGDVYSAVLSCAMQTNIAVAGHRGTLDGNDGSLTTGSIFSPRQISALGSAIAMESKAFVGDQAAAVISGVDPTLGVFPSVVDGQLKLSARYTRIGASDRTPRAVIPGVYTIPQSGVRAGGVNPGDVVAGSGDLAGRRLLAVGSGYSANPEGVSMIDITGPWR